MISYDDIKNHPKAHRTFTSLDKAEFEKLLIEFAKAWEEYVKGNYTKEQERQRKPGGGRKPKLDKLEDKLFFILFHFKTYPLQEVLGFLFGLSQGQANEWIHKLSEVLKMALGQAMLLPERDPKKLEEVLAECEMFEFIIDGTEREIQRPTDKEAQKEYYSGKKKRHTCQNNLIVDTGSRKVQFLSLTYEGKKSDKNICDEEGYTFPDNSVLFKDKGFQGYEPENVIAFQPKKKPKGEKLSAADKLINSIISSTRITVEHIISGVKRCRIVKDIFRNTKEGFADLVMEIACGLHNFRAECRYSAPSGDLLQIEF